MYTAHTLHTGGKGGVGESSVRGPKQVQIQVGTRQTFDAAVSFSRSKQRRGYSRPNVTA